jgi:hypothetical protein
MISVKMIPIKHAFGKGKLSDDEAVDKFGALLSNALSIPELQMLCFQLAVDYGDLPGNTQLEKAKELVSYLINRRQGVEELVQACSQLHPDLPWDNPDLMMSNLMISKRSGGERKIALTRIINYCFNTNELRDLCLDLGLDYEDLPGEGKSAKVRELVFYFSRPTRNIERLVETCIHLRPNAPWDAPQITAYEPYSDSVLARLRSVFMAHIDEDETRTLARSLGVDYKRLPEAERGGVARELILYLARRQRLNELVEACAHQYPNIPWQAIVDQSEE